jgi:hypothetical protein
MRDVPSNRAAHRTHRITVGKFAHQDLGTNHALDTIAPVADCSISATPEAGFRVPLVQ